MSELTNRIKRLSRAYKRFHSIENQHDLRKDKLTLNDYNMLFDILKELNRKSCEGVWCVSGNVADWCKKNGLFVTPPHGVGQYNSVNYWISTNTKILED